MKEDDALHNSPSPYCAVCIWRIDQQQGVRQSVSAFSIPAIHGHESNIPSLQGMIFCSSMPLSPSFLSHLDSVDEKLTRLPSINSTNVPPVESDYHAIRNTILSNFISLKYTALLDRTSPHTLISVTINTKLSDEILELKEQSTANNATNIESPLWT